MAKANPWSRCCKRNSLSNEGIFMILPPQYFLGESRDMYEFISERTLQLYYSQFVDNNTDHLVVGTHRGTAIQASAKHGLLNLPDFVYLFVSLFVSLFLFYFSSAPTKMLGFSRVTVMINMYIDYCGPQNVDIIGALAPHE